MNLKQYKSFPFTLSRQVWYNGIWPGAPNEYSWQISAPQPAYSWLARETGQIQNPCWQTENLTILWI